MLVHRRKTLKEKTQEKFLKMGEVTQGLDNIMKFMKEREERRNNGGKGSNFLFLKVGQSEKIYIASELDVNAENYNESVGLGLVAVEHLVPGHFPRKFVCTRDNEEGCYGCELQRKAWQEDPENANKKNSEWAGRVRMYLTALYENEDGETNPAIIVQTDGPSSIFANILELAEENGTVVGWQKYSRKDAGSGKSKYTITGTKGDVPDLEDYEFPDLREVAIKNLSYDEQKKFVAGLLGNGHSERADASNLVAVESGEISENPHNVTW